MYMQNADNSAEALIEGNIVYQVYTTGENAYGNTDIWGFRFLHNIYFNCPDSGIFYHQDNYPSSGVTIVSNFMWTPTPIRLGYPLGNGNHSNAIVAGNYLAGTGYSFYFADGWRTSTVTNNTSTRLDQRYVWHLETPGETNGNITSHRIDNNAYFAMNSGIVGSGPFESKGAVYSFENWKALIRGDTNSTFSYGQPSSVALRVFRPSNDPNFVHIVVFNWSQQPHATVDLSQFYQTGDQLSIYDAQAIPVAYTNFTYSGGLVSLELTRTNRAPMLGTFANPQLPWTGFDPRFRAFVIFRDTRLLPPTALRAEF